MFNSMILALQDAANNAVSTAVDAANTAGNAADAANMAAANAADASAATANMALANAAGKPPEIGIVPMLVQGGVLTWIVAGTLLFMLFYTLFILVTKYIEQNKVIAQGRTIGSNFWNAPTLSDAAGKLGKDTAYGQIVSDGVLAQEQHSRMTDAVDSHEWTQNALARSTASINSDLRRGLAFLATTGSTAPFIGLFGTVVGILNALLKIAMAGQASMETVAGPVGEALYMTAFGLLVAVPAVLAYNWLQGRNKMIAENLTSFSNSLYGYMGSGGAIRPMMRTAAPVRPTTSGPGVTASTIKK